MIALTCFRLHSEPGGYVAHFDDALREDRLHETRQFGPVSVGTVEAKLYIAASAPHDPDWAHLLRDGFGPEIPIPPVGGSSALLVARVPRDGETAFLAFAFGQGRFLLKGDSYVRGFGLRTSLNVIFEGDTEEDEIDPSRLRSADAKRVGRNILRTRHQVSETASLEALDVDTRKEVLRGVTGIPVSTSRWGRQITGTDALSFSWADNFASLDVLCHQILDAHERSDYQVRFSFVDDLKAITDPRLRTVLEEEIVGAVQGHDHEALGLAPPELINWELVTHFQYHSETRKGTVRRELDLTEYLTSLSSTQASALDRDSLKRWEIRALDQGGSEVSSWSVWRCLFGEIRLGESTYLLDDGEFYEVADDFLRDLDADLDAIPEFDGSFPDWIKGSREDAYNRKVADNDDTYLLLDKRDVRVPRQTSDIEICDLLRSDRKWIHVKRRTDGSKGLSHLFWQGFVSATLLLGEISFRKLVIDEIVAAELDESAAQGKPYLVGRFQVVKEEAVVAADHEIVFAILGTWNAAGILGLPFFSKISLRETVHALHERGLRVSLKRITGVSKAEL